MKPTIKPHQTPTFHRDGTVSWFSILENSWKRLHIKLVKMQEIDASFIPSDRRKFFSLFSRS
jgi:hypothetical protein